MIYGERIRLRAPERADIPMFKDWINDPDVRFGVSLYLPMSAAMEEQWFESMLKRPPDEHPLTIEVNEAGQWTAIGNIGLFSIDSIAHSGEVGIMIGNKEYWDRGFGAESMALMLKHAFETLNLNRVSLRVFEKNHRAIRCYEKVGYVHEGRLREAVYGEGKYSDLLMMGILRREWEESVYG